MEKGALQKMQKEIHSRRHRRPSASFDSIAWLSYMYRTTLHVIHSKFFENRSSIGAFRMNVFLFHE